MILRCLLDLCGILGRWGGVVGGVFDVGLWFDLFFFCWVVGEFFLAFQKEVF